MNRVMLLLALVGSLRADPYPDLLPVAGWYRLEAEIVAGGWLTVTDYRTHARSARWEWIGSATLLDDGRIVATHHQVDDVDGPVAVIGHGGAEAIGDVVATSPALDLSLIRLRPGQRLPPAMPLELIDWTSEPGDSGSPSRISADLFCCIVTHLDAGVPAAVVLRWLDSIKEER